MLLVDEAVSRTGDAILDAGFDNAGKEVTGTERVGASSCLLDIKEVMTLALGDAGGKRVVEVRGGDEESPSERTLCAVGAVPVVRREDAVVLSVAVDLDESDLVPSEPESSLRRGFQSKWAS